MRDSLISVIVPVFNTGQYLSRCIESLISQDYPHIEVIIVDDGSTDEQTVALCDELAEKNSSVFAYHTPNGGSAKARNHGISRASGDYIGFVDSDDIVEPEMYSCLLNDLLTNGVRVAIGGIETEENGRIIDSKRPLASRKYSYWELLHYFFLGYWHSACTNLYDRNLFAEIRFPDNEVNEDYLLNYLIFQQQEFVTYNNKPFYHYIRRPGSNTSSAISLKFLDWLRHTELVLQEYGDDPHLKEEAKYQYLHSNIVLANKSILTLAIQPSDDAKAIYGIAVNNLRKFSGSVLFNKYLSVKYRLYGLALILLPNTYRTVAVFFTKLSNKK